MNLKGYDSLFRGDFSYEEAKSVISWIEDNRIIVPDDQFSAKSVISWIEDNRIIVPDDQFSAKSVISWIEDNRDTDPSLTSQIESRLLQREK